MRRLRQGRWSMGPLGLLGVVVQGVGTVAEAEACHRSVTEGGAEAGQLRRQGSMPRPRLWSILDKGSEGHVPGVCSSSSTTTRSS